MTKHTLTIELTLACPEDKREAVRLAAIDAANRAALVALGQADPDTSDNDEIAALHQTLAEADAVIHFNSASVMEKRIRSKQPELARRAEIDALEAEAIARHMARRADAPGAG